MKKSLLLCVLLFISSLASAEKLVVGVTLHPYYSYVSKVAGDRAEVMPLIASGFNPHSYELQPADLRRLLRMDALVVNGIGHDEFVMHALEGLELPKLTVINANKDLPLLSSGMGSSSYNPHTFVSIDAAIRQIYTIAVELTNLSLQLNRVKLLEPLSAHFKPGQMHAITGPNGAGKSSLIKCLLGLMPHSGQIRRHWPGRPGNIAYVPQQAAFEPSLPVTIEEFMLTSVSRWPIFFKRKVAEQRRISRLLQRVGLEHKQHLRLGQLPGGERQRLLFAQALERDSHLWCIDEPMTGLDQLGQSLITAEMIQLRDQGATLFVVHHDMDWIRHHADEQWVIDEGLKRHEILCKPNPLHAVEPTEAAEAFA